MRVARSAFACALPRPSATASAKFANSTVSQSQTAITPTNQSEPVCPRARSSTKIPVVITLPSSTMNITGFLSWSRGSSFGNESRTAPRDDLAREDACRLAGHLAAACLVESEVELEHVHARLAEEAPRAADRVLRDQLLHGRERQVADGGDRARAWSCA